MVIYLYMCVYIYTGLILERGHAGFPQRILPVRIIENLARANARKLIRVPPLNTNLCGRN